MKSIFLVLAYWSCFFYGKAQEVNRFTEIRMALPNMVSKGFFLENPYVGSIIIEYSEGELVSLEVYYRTNDGRNVVPDEFYDLTFAGDWYRLRSINKLSDFLFDPKVGIINGTISIKPQEHQCKIREYIDMDSIKYELTISQVLQNEIHLLGTGRITATYGGGAEKLTADITSCCDIIKKEKKVKEESTVLLYRALVERDGSLHHVSIVLGESSFSERIKNCIEKTTTFWQPEVHGGRPVRSYVDIFVQINSNQEMMVSYSGLNRL